MPIAFLLLKTSVGAEIEVLEALKKIEAVKEAYLVYGVHDVVVQVRADTMDKLKDVVTQNLRKLDKVKSTLTMMAIEETYSPASLL